MQRDKKLVSAWTQGGQLFVKFTTATAEKPKLIKTAADFNSNG